VPGVWQHQIKQQSGFNEMVAGDRPVRVVTYRCVTRHVFFLEADQMLSSASVERCQTGGPRAGRLVRRGLVRECHAADK
jgi:hypothetical protein